MIADQEIASADNFNSSNKEINPNLINYKTIKEKDLNDMHLAGHDVKQIVKSNTFQGAEAKVKLTFWKKV